MAEDKKLPEKTSNELAAERTDMAAERTDMAVYRTVAAYDRTLIAWVRTAVSLISFGFTIYKFFQAIVEKGTQLTFGVLGPRHLGIIMLTMGFLSLVFATLQNHVQLRDLRKLYPDVKISFPFSILLAISMGLLAAFLLVLAIIKE